MPEVAANPSEPDVRELLARWTAAQSSNDFAAYAKLYASKFTGIKRAGSAIFQFRRADWMADRKTMIGPGLTVEVSDVRLALSPSGARVEFVQHYKSARYEDTGKKQLFVVSTAEGARIAREEMLTSSVSAQATGGHSAPIHAAESSGVFLMALPEFKAPKTGVRALHPEWLIGDEAEALVPETAFNADARAFIGRELTAYDANAKPCSARVKALTMRAAVDAMLDTVEGRKSYLNEEDADAAKSLGRTVFALGYSYVFGVFDKPCPGARWAIQGGPGRVYPARTGDAEHLAAARTSFRKLPAYAAIQAPFEKFRPALKPPPWDSPADKVLFTEFSPEGAAPRAVLSVRHSTLCGEFNGMLSVVFDMSHPEKPVPRGIVDPGDNEVTVVAALDTDGDGELEYVAGPDGLTSDVLLLRRNGSGAFTRESLFVVPNTICPC